MIIKEDVFKVSFSYEKDKFKWKKMKVTMNDNCFSINSKEKNELTLYFKNINISQYVKSNLISINDSESKNIIFIKLDKKYQEWVSELSNRVGFKSTFENINEKEKYSPKLSTTIALSNFVAIKNIKNVSRPQITVQNNTFHRVSGVGDYLLNNVNIKTVTRYFGGNLDEIYKKYDYEFPNFLYRMLKFIEDNGYNIPGIYRESGTTSGIQQLKEELENNDFNNINKWDIHDVASTIKLFFREINPKIIPNDVLKSFLSIKSTSDKILLLIDKIGNLPLPNRSIIYHLVLHFKYLNEYCDKNLMDLKNLSVVFGPTLVESDALDIANAADMLKVLLNNHEKLIDDVKFMQNIKVSKSIMIKSVSIDLDTQSGSLTYTPQNSQSPLAEVKEDNLIKPNNNLRKPRSHSKSKSDILL